MIRAVGLAPGTVAAASDWPRDVMLGEMTTGETRAHWQQRLGLSDEQVDELVEDSWRWYVGRLDQRSRGSRLEALIAE